MKKISKILVLVLVAAFIVFGALNMQDQEVVKAYNTEASYITINIQWTCKQ